MLNFLWGGMILIGIIYGAINGTMPQVNTAAIESAREAVTLCITMLGVMGLWLGKPFRPRSGNAAGGFCLSG